MLPSRMTLRSWKPDALAGSAAAISAAAGSVASAVSGIDTACAQMPETRAWSGRSHEAASAMFGRANRDATKVSDYAKAVAAALNAGGSVIGQARAALLAKADQVDAGPLIVSDQWAVLIDPVRMSADDLAKLQKLAVEEQGEINALLTAVGDADESTANAVAAVGARFGFVEARPSGDPFSIPTMPGRPRDQVPDPRDPIGLLDQQALRNGDMAISVREVIESENSYGDEVTTVIMQDGSKQVISRKDPFDWPSKQDFVSVEHFDKDGNEISRSSS